MADNSGLPEGFRAVQLPPGFYDVPAPKGQEAKREPVKPDRYSILGGAIMDTLGLSDRPGAVPLTGSETTKTPLGVVLNPGAGPKMGLGNVVDPLLEHATSAAVTAPLTAGGGAALKAAPWVGRALVSGVLGAAQAAAKGKSALAGGAIDAATSAATEGLFALVPKAKVPFLTRSIQQITDEFSEVKDAFARRAKAYQAATDAVGAAFDAIKDRLPAAGVKWLYVPAISAKKLSADEAKAGLESLEGPSYEAARKQILNELNAMDKRAAKKLGQNLYTGQEFGVRTAPSRFQPKPLEDTAGMRRAQAVTDVAANPLTRAVADTAMTQKEPRTDAPVGAFAAAAALEGLENLPGTFSHLIKGAAGR